MWLPFALAEEQKVESAAPSAAVQPPGSATRSGLWETRKLIEQFEPNSTVVKRRTGKVEKECVQPGTNEARSTIINIDALPLSMEKCWKSDARSEGNKTQVKMACKDGTTAEAVSRIEADGSIGFMTVFNIPKEGSITITGTSRKIADACEPVAGGKAE
jgi:hypothetical protein